MRGEELINRRNQSPFQPFRIHVSDGAAFDLPHPEMLHVSRSMAMIFEPASDLGEGSFEDYYLVVLHHITRIEPLERKASA